jgi:hypothetical protein
MALVQIWDIFWGPTQKKVLKFITKNNGKDGNLPIHFRHLNVHQTNIKLMRDL